MNRRIEAEERGWLGELEGIKISLNATRDKPVDPGTLEGKAADAYALLAVVAGQDVEPAEDSDDGTDGRWRIARRVAPDRMISTVDRDTRHAYKTQSRQQDGFKAHIVIEPPRRN